VVALTIATAQQDPPVNSSDAQRYPAPWPPWTSDGGHEILPIGGR
jgi:hypothetical protein